MRSPDPSSRLNLFLVFFPKLGESTIASPPPRHAVSMLPAQLTKEQLVSVLTFLLQRLYVCYTYAATTFGRFLVKHNSVLL